MSGAICQQCSHREFMHDGNGYCTVDDCECMAFDPPEDERVSRDTLLEGK